MRILALETSTLWAGAAVVVDGQVLAEESSSRQRSHSEVINVFIENVLKKSALKISDIDLFATGQGPGSFTGIRVAANAAKSFAYSFNKPLVTVDTLMQLAAQAGNPGMPVLAIVNAHKNMVYTGLFDVSGPLPTYLHGPTAVSVRDLSALVHQPVLVVGDGYADYQEYFPAELKSHLHRNGSLPDFPHAGTLGNLAERLAKKGLTLDWKSFRPLYIRASEAEENKRGIVIKPLT